MSVRFLIVCGGSGVNLLGQRQVLGVDAELQIDVSKDNVVKRWKGQDTRSFVLELDQNVGTTGLLFRDARKEIREDGSISENCWEYVQQGIYKEPDIRHVSFLVRHSASTLALERGLAQSPAIGGLTIRHNENRQALEQVIDDMTGELGLGPENPLEVWIVASTAGGTGEGIHRFVAAYLAEFLSRRYTDTPLTVNFIRIGQLTYRSVNYQRTALNTFFGVAADAAFALKASKERPEVPIHWFYVDIPDVGMGERSVPLRAQNVEMAAKAVMLEELQEDLQRLLVNNGGIPMVLTRTGYWGRDFGEQRLYYETLRQLREKLRKLVTPDYERRYIDGEGQQQPRLEGEEAKLKEWIQRVSNTRHITQRIDQEQGVQFPKYRLRSYPTNLEEVREQLRDWKTALEGLLGEDLVSLKADWMVDRARYEDGEVHRERVPLRVSMASGTEFGREQWFQRVEEAHEALAWSRALLGCDLQQGTPRKGGRLEQLLNGAQEISKALYAFNPFKSSDARMREAAAELGGFLSTLVEVDLLLRLEEESRKALDTELGSSRQVLEMVESEFAIISRAVGSSVAEVVRAAELSDPLDPATQDTWLQLLDKATRRGDRESFKVQVRRGATGLTKAGLVDVLGLRPQADISEIHDELTSRMGRMYDLDNNEYEARWWASTSTVGTLKHDYRILPGLDPELQAGMEAYKSKRVADYRYVFTKMGTIGLYVLAFNGISLTRSLGDTRSMPTFLMKPFVRVVQDTLSRWEAKPRQNEPSGQLELVQAGVAGEPLYKQAMQDAGLTDEDLEKVAEFYNLYEAPEENV